MKLLAQQIFFTEKVAISVLGSYGKLYLRNSLLDGSPTLIIAPYDRSNENKRRYHQMNLNQAYCRACDSFFIASTDSYSICCPSCGHRHQADHIIRTRTGKCPSVIKTSLYEYKERLKLVVRFKGFDLGENIFDDWCEIKGTEEFSFEPEKRNITWTKTVHRQNKKDIVKKEDIGYLNDELLLPQESVIQFLDIRFKDKNGKTFTETIRLLREKVNKRMVQAGFSKRKMAVTGRKDVIALDSLMAIAHQTRFWDSEKPEFLGEGCSYTREQLFKEENTIDEISVNTSMSVGKTYTDAVLETALLPNNKTVRRNLSLQNIPKLQNIYSSIDNLNDANEFVSMYFKTKNRYNWNDAFSFYTEFKQFYKDITPTSSFRFMDKPDNRDIIHLWKTADKITKQEFLNQKPAIKDIHDTLSFLIAKQNDREIHFDIPEETIKAFSKDYKDYKINVLTLYSSIKKAGMELKNCAASYKNRINKNHVLALMTDNKNKAVALFEIRDKQIVQARLFDNVPICNNANANAFALQYAADTGLEINTYNIQQAA